ncbi:hypothetical protein [Bartonella bilalgolemii]|uniref:Uncharacterized protein n=1 Tax=Bartonella bilalgolemii TaxID=2942911 RepID=A0ABT0PA26_9HYPH|nr:hypothetical protein [Bartonella sp. G70]MCL6229992.1 hypothetical protein [Bartonella sp. G70]
MLNYKDILNYHALLKSTNKHQRFCEVFDIVFNVSMLDSCYVSPETLRIVGGYACGNYPLTQFNALMDNVRKKVVIQIKKRERIITIPIPIPILSRQKINMICRA